MTIRINDGDIGQLIEFAAWTGSILVLLVIGFIFYLVVRPARRAAVEREDPIAAEDMLRLMERMEQRLETLERALRNEEAERDRPQLTGHGPEHRRIK